jgi:endo-1,4-beta-xylanase
MRHKLSAIALLLVVLFGGASAVCQSLRQQADSAGILIGTAVRAPQLSETDYSATLAREFNLVEAEDAMKWWVLRPDAQTFDFSQGDRIVEFARTHSMKVRGHTLVWGRSNPAWLTEPRFTAEQLSTLLQGHIQRVVSHYRGEVFAWDVVNEAFDERGQLRSSLWYDQPGIGLAGKATAYIEQVFRWAHAADPAALLFFNDAEAETMNVKSDAILAMVQDFKRRGVPINGVGLQMHIFDLRPDVAGIEANIARFSALGIQVHITELDVALATDEGGQVRNTADLGRQADIYRAIAQACLRHPGCSAIQAWGFTDRYSWIRSTTKGTKGAALPFDRAYAPKPAYFALREALSRDTSQPSRAPSQ